MGHAAVLARLLANNAQWAEDVDHIEPGFHHQSAKGQSPKVLWIGCSDSRVPESVVTASKPGDIFVHRNIANQVHPEDFNLLSVLTYAVLHLGVEHIIVVGHTQCGGAAAACSAAASSLSSSSDESNNNSKEPLERWLSPLVDLAKQVISEEGEGGDLGRKVVERSVKRSIQVLSQTPPLQKAWKDLNLGEKGSNVTIHGWIYDIESGRLDDLGVSFCGRE
ncbi:Carbonic anhydrase [Abortiporus biennis]